MVDYFGYKYEKDKVGSLQTENYKLKKIILKLITGVALSDQDDTFLSLVMEDEE
jgi:hypothetical protein